MVFKRNLIIISAVLFFILSFGVVYASDNVTEDVSPNIDTILENEVSVFDNFSAENSNQIVSNGNVNAKIESSNIDSYYKEKNELFSQLKDDNDNPIQNKSLSIFLNGKTYNRTTDVNGSVKLPLNLKPGSYNALINFAGDDVYSSANINSNIKIKKVPLALKTSDYSTYVNSDNFFTAKVYNKVTDTPVKGIKVLFKVYSNKTKKFKEYYRTTDENGIATLNKHLKVGLYTVYTQINDSKNKKFISNNVPIAKATLKVDSLADEDCCSFYVQVSKTESVCGFRRDNTGSAVIQVKSEKWYGRTAVKHFKYDGDYFCHLIATSDGWMMGNGGLDGGSSIRDMERLAADMIKSNEIKMENLRKIQKYKIWANFGHFSIKAPDGRFAVVYQNNIITGKLKPGEFLCNPNFQSYHRRGDYHQYGTNPAKVAIKVGATDHYGIYRRQIVVFHWKEAVSKDFKISSRITAYAANDDGRFVGVSSGSYVDSIKFEGKSISGYKLPRVPNAMRLGTYSFPDIDNLVKIPTKIKAPAVKNKFHKNQYFKFKVKNKKTGKAVGNAKLKIKISNSKKSYTYTIRTDKNGYGKFNTKKLPVGTYKVVLSPANSKYIMSATSKIIIYKVAKKPAVENTTEEVNPTVDDINATDDSYGNETLQLALS
jgi:hypothetical protein